MAEIENPTIEEPTQEPKQEGTEAEAPDVDSLVKELEKAGVKTTQELQGKLRASQETGKLAEMVGDYRREIEDLKQAMKQEPVKNDYDEYSETPVDIESLMNNVLDKREAKTRQIQQQAMQIWQGIQSDPDYKLVKEVWENKVKDPNFNIAVSSGKKDVAKEYMETVREYYKGIAKKSLDTITTLQQGVVPATPHVEGEAHLPNIPIETETPEALTKAKEKVEKGGRLSEDEEMAALAATLQGS